MKLIEDKIEIVLYFISILMYIINFLQITC